MDNFDKLYEEEIMRINEGAFKSLATASALGIGALAGANNGAKEYNQTPAVQPRANDDFIINKTLPITKWAEGFREGVYEDSEGIPSVGFGFNLRTAHIRKELENVGYDIENIKNRNEVVDEAKAEIVLKRLMVQALNDAKQFVNNFDELDPIAQIVLVDMSYNMGLTKLSKFKNFKSALESQDYYSAKKEMIDSKWYTDVGRRSKRLVQLMDTLADRT